MKKIILQFICIMAMCLSANYLFSQSIHFTNNDIVPTYFNPAQTGAYSGTFKAGLILRDQWRPGANAPYTSGGLFIDSPIVFGLTKQHWVGVGATLLYDQAGSNTLNKVQQTWSEFIPGVSYNIGLDKKFNNVFTIGVQYGFANRGYSKDGWKTEEGVLANNSNYIDPDLERITESNSNDNFSLPTSHLNVGILYKSNIDKYSKFEVGGAFMNVLNSELKFKGVTATHPDSGETYAPLGTIKEGSRLNVHTKYRRATSRRMIWEPSAYLSFMPGASNINIQLRNEYLLKKKGDISLITGLGLRFGDSVQLLLGANYKGYLVSFSYDHTISEHLGYTAAYELGVSRIFIVNKKPKVKPIIYCPRL